MYPPSLTEGLKAVEIDALTVADLRLSGSSDAETFGAAIASGRSVLTENVGDFTRIAADHSTAGHRHPGVLIALSSRFSRRQASIPRLIAAIQATANDQLEDRVVYLQQPDDR
jgi:hypothetical protein